jgi:hypothetical protein
MKALTDSRPSESDRAPSNRVRKAARPEESFAPEILLAGAISRPGLAVLVL